MDKEITTSKKEVHKTAEFIENKISNAVTKSNSDNIDKREPIEELIFRPEKKGNIKQIAKSIAKMEHYKISKLLNHSTVSKFVTKNGSK